MFSPKTLTPIRKTDKAMSAAARSLTRFATAAENGNKDVATLVTESPVPDFAPEVNVPGEQEQRLHPHHGPLKLETAILGWTLAGTCMFTCALVGMR